MAILRRKWLYFALLSCSTSLRRNGKGTEKERERNAFLKIGKGTGMERVPRFAEIFNALVVKYAVNLILGGDKTEQIRQLKLFLR